MHTEKNQRTYRHARTAIIILTVLTVTFIWSNSLKNGSESMSASNSILDIIKPILDPGNRISADTFSFFLRKAAHFTEYMILGAELSVLRRLFLCDGIHTEHLLAPFTVLTVATVDETIQRFTERTSSTLDVILDFCGGMSGVLIACAIVKLFIARKRRKKNACKDIK